MKKTYSTLFSLTTVMAILVGVNRGNLQSFHSEKELKELRALTRAGTGPTGTNSLFGGSGLCAGCHGHDPVGYAMVTSWGQDVNVYDDWAGTMMANSAKDPFWRAKVSHEILVNPANQVAFETKCTSCHAPLGHFAAIHDGAPSYLMSDLVLDSLGRDGVSCGACHQLKDTLIAKFFSGNLIYDTTKTVYGPFPVPFAGPMESFIGFKVEKGEHIAKAGLCAGCHTLITDAHDLLGAPTGTTFVEQATYHEWVNSTYNNESNPDSGITCQGCHMPRINENIVIAANFSFLGGRKPYGQHHLVGANSFMLDLMKNNSAALGITALPVHFDSAIVRTNKMMQDSAVLMNLTLTSRTVDTAFYELKLTNKAGHKFPSGYPSRRAFVQFVVLDDNGDTLFKNGMLNSAYQLIGQDATFEPHHNKINNENDVQIYELVAGDVNSDVTTVLERAFVCLKDNRLTPEGFTTSHFAYDTTKIVGGALTDADFNYEASVEGSGTDIIHFSIPMYGYTGDLNVASSLYYQSVPHKWLDEMFSFVSPEITSFQTMFNAADHTPLLVAQIKDGNLWVDMNEVPMIVPAVVYPNPSISGTFYVQNVDAVNEITVYSLSGAMVLKNRNANSFTLPRRGTYIVRIKYGNKEFTEKIIY
jgi:Secretion system C-terminal sorting domain/Cytochrome c554 and c-prime